MLESERQARELEKFAESSSTEIYGLHWGDPEKHPFILRVRDEFLLPNLQPGMTVLEIGSGGGRWSRYFVDRVERAILVDATTASEAAIRKHCNWPDFEFLLSPDGSLSSLADESIDFAFSFDTFVHFDKPLFDRYVAELGRVLKPNATLVLHYAHRWPECEPNERTFRYRDDSNVAALLAANGLALTGRQIEFRGGNGSKLVETVRVVHHKSMLEITPRAAISQDGYHQQAWRYVVNAAVSADIAVEEKPSLVKTHGYAFECALDEQLFVLDYNDFPTPQPSTLAGKRCGRIVPHFVFHLTAMHLDCNHLHSFPVISFLDWERRPQASWRPGEVVLNKQVPYKTPSQCHLRRGRAAEILANCRFPVDASIDNQETFFEKALNCLTSVHIPGAWRHSLDRGQYQLFGLGVCTVSPEIWTYVGDCRPEAGVHYVLIRDDYSDLLEKIEWCAAHRDECLAIGARAKALFTGPREIWAHVRRKLSGAEKQSASP